MENGDMEIFSRKSVTTHAGNVLENVLDNVISWHVGSSPVIQEPYCVKSAFLANLQQLLVLHQIWSLTEFVLTNCFSKYFSR
eukprot:3786411-Ditylum_brightwellii.AAC.1